MPVCVIIYWVSLTQVGPRAVRGRARGGVAGAGGRRGRAARVPPPGGGSEGAPLDN